MKVINVFKIITSPFIDVYINARDTKKNLNFIEIIRINIKYRLAAYFGLCIDDNISKLKSYQNRYVGKRAFIIGNGPSLNKIDLTLLKDEYTFGVNAIYTNYERMGFYPNFHVIEDVFVAEDRSDEINGHNESIKFFGNYLSYCLDASYNTCLLNVEFNYSEKGDWPKFSTNALRKTYVGGTVSYICMQLAFYMGFSEVYLVGFDHNYVIKSNVNKRENALVSQHNDDPNHFSGDYFGKDKRWHDPRVERMELAYKKAKIYYEKDSRIIRNATEGGRLDVFDRVKYSSLFR